MKNTKLFLIPAMMILLVSLIAVISAASVTVSLFYDATDSSSLAITNGDSFGISVSADSIFEDSMSIKLDLLNSQGNVVTNILDTYTTSDSYSKHLTVSQAAYITSGDYTLRATVTSASGQSDTSVLCLKVNTQIPPVNHVPVITSTPVTEVNEGKDYGYQVTATDADGDALAYSLTQNPSWISISADGKILGTAPLVDYDTSYVITVKVSDSKSFVTQKFEITVKDVPVPPVNHVPVITSNPLIYVDEGQYYNYQVTAIDEDGDSLGYSLTQTPSWLSIDSNGLITGIAPLVDSNTDYPIMVKVYDYKSVTAQTFALRVRNIPVPPANHAPVITSNPVTEVDEEEYYSYRIIATDEDNDVLMYAIEQGPSWLSIDSNGIVSGTAPSVTSDEQYSVILSVSDHISVVKQNFEITVKNICHDDGDDDDDDNNEGNNNGANYISDEDGTNQYLGQFNPITITEEEEVLNKAAGQTSSFGSLWIWLLIVILILIIILVYLWMRK